MVCLSLFLVVQKSPLSKPHSHIVCSSLFTAVCGTLVYRLVYCTYGRERSLTRSSGLHHSAAQEAQKAQKTTGELDGVPDALHLARDPNRHLAFGRGGVHHCPGAPLARLEEQLAINTFLQRFPEASLALTPEPVR